MAENRIDFGVVNYNGGASLLDCVRSIFAQRDRTGHVLVFDNASSDGSAAAVETAFPDAVVIRSDRNLGYAGALNRLLEHMDAEVVVLSNMDLEFDPGWTEAVMAALRAAPEADAVSTLVVETTDPPVVNSVGVRFFADLHAQNVGSGELYEPERTEVLEEAGASSFGSYGAVMCFRREAVRDVAFDEDYFLFFEETDFFLRFHLLGRRTTFSAGAVARHQRSLSTRRFSPLKLYYGERNRLTTVFKLLPVWYWPLSLVHTFRRLLALARSMGAGEGGGGSGMVTSGGAPVMPSKPTIVWTLLRAWGAAVMRLPSTLRKRRRFWRRAPGDPPDALAVVRAHALEAAELRLR